MAIHVNSAAAPVERAKIKQLHVKLASTATIEIELLNVFQRRLNNVITTALTKGASRMIHGKIKFMGYSSAQNFKLVMSFTSVVCLARNRATRMARPTATSAAATVMMKKTNTCAL